MADYDKYDARVDSLVIERRTQWDSTVGNLSDEDRLWLGRLVHEHPERAMKVAYDRSHTGFARTITVTADDIARIYDDRVAGR